MELYKICTWYVKTINIFGIAALGITPLTYYRCRKIFAGLCYHSSRFKYLSFKGLNNIICIQILRTNLNANISTSVQTKQNYYIQNSDEYVESNMRL
jgi:hypothetical protein